MGGRSDLGENDSCSTRKEKAGPGRDRRLRAEALPEGSTRGLGSRQGLPATAGRHSEHPPLNEGFLRAGRRGAFLEGKDLHLTLSHLPPSFPGQVDPVKLRQSVRTVLLNQLLISLPIVVFLYPALKLWRDPCRRELPTFHWFLLELAVFTLIEEIMFYYSHR